MARRWIGQEQLGFASEAAGRTGSLDELARRIDRTEIDRLLAGIYGTEKGEQGWLPLALLVLLCHKRAYWTGPGREAAGTSG